MSPKKTSTPKLSNAASSRRGSRRPEAEPIPGKYFHEVVFRRFRNKSGYCESFPLDDGREVLWVRSTWKDGGRDLLLHSSLFNPAEEFTKLIRALEDASDDAFRGEIRPDLRDWLGSFLGDFAEQLNISKGFDKNPNWNAKAALLGHSKVGRSLATRWPRFFSALYVAVRRAQGSKAHDAIEELKDWAVGEEYAKKALQEWKAPPGIVEALIKVDATYGLTRKQCLADYQEGIRRTLKSGQHFPTRMNLGWA